MNEHMTEWMDAYLDGELPAARARQMETHLSACPDCRERLERRRGLSLLLADTPAVETAKAESRFVAEVALQLQRRGPAAAPKAQTLHLGWLLFPVGLVLAGVFVQVALILNLVVSAIPGAEQALSAQSGLLSSVPALPEPVSGMLGLAEFISLPGLNWVSLLVMLGMIAVLYVGWLASWFARNRHAAGLSNEVV